MGRAGKKVVKKKKKKKKGSVNSLSNHGEPVHQFQSIQTPPGQQQPQHHGIDSSPQDPFVFRPGTLKISGGQVQQSVAMKVSVPALGTSGQDNNSVAPVKPARIRAGTPSSSIAKPTYSATDLVSPFANLFSTNPHPNQSVQNQKDTPSPTQPTTKLRFSPTPRPPPPIIHKASDEVAQDSEDLHLLESAFGVFGWGNNKTTKELPKQQHQQQNEQAKLSATFGMLGGFMGFGTTAAERIKPTMTESELKTIPVTQPNEMRRYSSSVHQDEAQQQQQQTQLQPLAANDIDDKLRYNTVGKLEHKVFGSVSSSDAESSVVAAVAVVDESIQDDTHGEMQSLTSTIENVGDESTGVVQNSFQSSTNTFESATNESTGDIQDEPTEDTQSSSEIVEGTSTQSQRVYTEETDQESMFSVIQVDHKGRDRVEGEDRATPGTNGHEQRSEPISNSLAETENNRVERDDGPTVKEEAPGAAFTTGNLDTQEDSALEISIKEKSTNATNGDSNRSLGLAIDEAETPNSSQQYQSAVFSQAASKIDEAVGAHHSGAIDEENESRLSIILQKSLTSQEELETSHDFEEESESSQSETSTNHEKKDGGTVLVDQRILPAVGLVPSGVFGRLFALADETSREVQPSHHVGGTPTVHGASRAHAGEILNHQESSSTMEQPGVNESNDGDPLAANSPEISQLMTEPSSRFGLVDSLVGSDISAQTDEEEGREFRFGILNGIVSAATSPLEPKPSLHDDKGFLDIFQSGLASNVVKTVTSARSLFSPSTHDEDDDDDNEDPELRLKRFRKEAAAKMEAMKQFAEECPSDFDETEVEAMYQLSSPLPKVGLEPLDEQTERNVRELWLDSEGSEDVRRGRTNENDISVPSDCDTETQVESVSTERDGPAQLLSTNGKEGRLPTLGNHTQTDPSGTSERAVSEDQAEELLGVVHDPSVAGEQEAGCDPSEGASRLVELDGHSFRDQAPPETGDTTVKEKSEVDASEEGSRMEINPIGCLRSGIDEVVEEQSTQANLLEMDNVDRAFGPVKNPMTRSDLDELDDIEVKAGIPLSKTRGSGDDENCRDVLLHFGAGSETSDSEGSEVTADDANHFPDRLDWVPAECSKEGDLTMGGEERKTITREKSSRLVKVFGLDSSPTLSAESDCHSRDTPVNDNEGTSATINAPGLSEMTSDSSRGSYQTENEEYHDDSSAEEDSTFQDISEEHTTGSEHDSSRESSHFSDEHSDYAELSTIEEENEDDAITGSDEANFSDEVASTDPTERQIVAQPIAEICKDSHAATDNSTVFNALSRRASIASISKEVGGDKDKGHKRKERISLGEFLRRHSSKAESIGTALIEDDSPDTGDKTWAESLLEDVNNRSFWSLSSYPSLKSIGEDSLTSNSHSQEHKTLRQNLRDEVSPALNQSEQEQATGSSRLPSRRLLEAHDNSDQDSTISSPSIEGQDSQEAKPRPNLRKSRSKRSMRSMKSNRSQHSSASMQSRVSSKSSTSTPSSEDIWSKVRSNVWRLTYSPEPSIETPGSMPTLTSFESSTGIQETEDQHDTTENDESIGSKKERYALWMDAVNTEKEANKKVFDGEDHEFSEEELPGSHVPTEIEKDPIDCHNESVSVTSISRDDAKSQRTTESAYSSADLELGSAAVSQDEDAMFDLNSRWGAEDGSYSSLETFSTTCQERRGRSSTISSHESLGLLTRKSQPKRSVGASLSPESTKDDNSERQANRQSDNFQQLRANLVSAVSPFSRIASQIATAAEEILDNEVDFSKSYHWEASSDGSSYHSLQPVINWDERGHVWTYSDSSDDHKSIVLLNKHKKKKRMTKSIESFAVNNGSSSDSEKSREKASRKDPDELRVLDHTHDWSDGDSSGSSKHEILQSHSRVHSALHDLASGSVHKTEKVTKGNDADGGNDDDEKDVEDSSLSVEDFLRQAGVTEDMLYDLYRAEKRSSWLMRVTRSSEKMSMALRAAKLLDNELGDDTDDGEDDKAVEEKRNDEEETETHGSDFVEPLSNNTNPRIRKIRGVTVVNAAANLFRKAVVARHLKEKYATGDDKSFLSLSTWSGGSSHHADVSQTESGFESEFESFTESFSESESESTEKSKTMVQRQESLGSLAEYSTFWNKLDEEYMHLDNYVEDVPLDININLLRRGGDHGGFYTSRGFYHRQKDHRKHSKKTVGKVVGHLLHHDSPDDASLMEDLSAHEFRALLRDDSSYLAMIRKKKRHRKKTFGDEENQIGGGSDGFSSDSSYDSEDSRMGIKKYLSGRRLYCAVFLLCGLLVVTPTIFLTRSINVGESDLALEPTNSPTMDFSTKSWEQIANSLGGEESRDQTGFSMSLSDDGTLLAVGSRRQSSNGLRQSGAVRLFRLIENGVGHPQWVVSRILLGDTAKNQFGFSVALSGDGRRLAVGSVGDDTKGENSGKVQVFASTSEDWELIGEFFGVDGGDVFGASVAVSHTGRVLAVGSPFSNVKNQEKTGAVFFYEDIGFAGNPRWIASREKVEGSTESDWFGWSVSLSSDASRLAVGAPLSPGRSAEGYVRVFDFDGFDSRWKQSGNDISISGEGNRFGYSVSIDAGGRRIAIGAHGSIFGGTRNGEAFVYHRGADGNWQILGFSVLGKSEGDNFGYAVSISRNGQYLAVGAPNHLFFMESSDQGMAVPSESNGKRRDQSVTGSTEPLAVDCSNETLPDDSLSNSTLGDTGQTIAPSLCNSANEEQMGSEAPTASPTIDPAVVGIGMVRVFKWSTEGVWKASMDIIADVRGNLGFSVGLTASGDQVAVGLPIANEARVYR